LIPRIAPGLGSARSASFDSPRSAVPAKKSDLQSRHCSDFYALRALHHVFSRCAS
jgi:hypothetical protein